MIAIDKSRRKVAQLRKNAERFSLSSIHSFIHDATQSVDRTLTTQVDTNGDLKDKYRVSSNFCIKNYSETPVMWTPLGPIQSVLIRGVSSFQGLLNMGKIHSGPHAVSALLWMSLFHGCLQGGVPLYSYVGVGGRRELSLSPDF